MSEKFVKVVLYTGKCGGAEFGEETVSLDPAGNIGFLSEVKAARAYQLRHSPVGFESGWHCTTEPQWVFILQGIMEIELPTGEKRQFKAGEHFFSTDQLPADATFTAGVHGHRSRQVGQEPLRTLFVKV